MNKMNAEAKRRQENKGNMKVCGQTINHQVDELHTEVFRAQGKTKEKFEELEKKCCGKLTEHHEWITDLRKGNRV